MARVIEEKGTVVASKPRNEGFNSISTGTVSMLAVNIAWEGGMLTLCHEKAVFYFKSENRTVFTHFFRCGPIHRSYSISLNPPPSLQPTYSQAR